jgi:hypothetical protein
MKEDTVQLKQFLDKHFIKNIPSFKPAALSKTSVSFLHHLFALLVKGDEEFHKSSIQSDTKNTFTRSELFHYIPSSIQPSIESMDKSIQTISFTIRERSFKITFCSPKKHPIKPSVLFLHVRRIYIWFYLAGYYANKKCSQSIHVHLYLTSHKKILPKQHNAPIDEEHANTAFTTSCQKETEINIYREEECAKVLIHETFHCMGLDFSEFNASETNKEILRIFPVVSDVRLFETYCETWAELFNIMFLSYFSVRMTENLETNIQKMLKKTQVMLHYEQMFSLFQCAKVLQHFDMTYKHMHEKTEGSQTIRKNKYKENTHVLSYYVIKSILMFQMNRFIEWCVDNNHRSIDFNKTKSAYNKTVASYCSLIREHYIDEDFVQSIQWIENWYQRHNEKRSMEMRTLRMSLFEG